MIVHGFSSMMDTNWQEGLLSKAFNRGSIDDQFERLPCIAQPRCHSQLRRILLHRLPGSVDVLPLRRVSAVRGVAQVPRLAAVDNHDQKFDFQSGTDTLFTHCVLIGLASPQAVQIVSLFQKLSRHKHICTSFEDLVKTLCHLRKMPKKEKAQRP